MLSFVVACPNICENDDTLKTWHILPVPRTSLSMRAKREKKKKRHVAWLVQAAALFQTSRLYLCKGYHAENTETILSSHVCCGQTPRLVWALAFIFFFISFVYRAVAEPAERRRLVTFQSKHLLIFRSVTFVCSVAQPHSTPHLPQVGHWQEPVYLSVFLNAYGTGFYADCWKVSIHLSIKSMLKAY